MHEQRAAIRAPVVLTGGAVFDYVSATPAAAAAVDDGPRPRVAGPLWIEPRRLAARYLVGNPLFAARVLLHRARRGRHVTPANPVSGRPGR